MSLEQEKKRLEDTIGELRLHATSSSGHTAATPLAAPLSPESKAVIQELESPRAIAELRTELSDVKSEMQRLTEEVCALILLSHLLLILTISPS